MTTKVTSRDKKLLVILCVFLVCMGAFWFGIRPLNEEISENRTQLANLKLEENQIRYMLQNMDTVKASIVEENAVLQESSDAFYSIMESHIVDELITGLALKYGLEQPDLRDLYIEYPSGELVIAPYLDEEAKPEPMLGVYGVSTKFVLKADRSVLQQYLDLLLNDCPAIRVVSFSWSGTDEEQPYILTVNLQVYMTDNASVEEAPEQTDEN